MADATNNPEEMAIDKVLIEKWFEIEPATPLDMPIPRIAMDLLYVAVEKPYFATANLVEMITADHRGDLKTRDTALDALKGDLLQGINALRQFQSIIMANATGLHLDKDWRVSGEVGHD